MSGRHAGAMVLAVLGAAGPVLPGPAVAVMPESPAQHCRRVGNDDTVLTYAPALKAGYLRAFRVLYPRARGLPSEGELANASRRCMDGRLLACFTGANLPCVKINAARRNPGAEAFCRANPSADVVPMVATGHDAAYAYRCRGGRAEATGATYELDARGFAKELWAPID